MTDFQHLVQTLTVKCPCGMVSIPVTADAVFDQGLHYHPDLEEYCEPDGSAR